jgi:type IV secretory pathway VirB2 component (pilin)
MANFEDFNLIFQNLVSYFTGSYPILAILIVVVFILVLLARGVDFRYSAIFVIPLIGFFVAIGWFGSIGAAQWVVNLILIVVAFFYGAAIIKLTT